MPASKDALRGRIARLLGRGARHVLLDGEWARTGRLS
jgi:hypothetical protein